MASAALDDAVETIVPRDCVSTTKVGSTIGEPIGEDSIDDNSHKLITQERSGKTKSKTKGPPK